MESSIINDFIIISTGMIVISLYIAFMLYVYKKEKASKIKQSTTVDHE